MDDIDMLLPGRCIGGRLGMSRPPEDEDGGSGGGGGGGGGPRNMEG